MSVSFKGSKNWAGAQFNGAVIQTAVGYNTTNSTKVFAARSTYEEVPGTLRCSLTPKFANSAFIVRVHLYWGGFTGGTDVATMFKIGWGTAAGQYPMTLGPLWNEGQISENKSQTSGVNTGSYYYNFGDGNHSACPDSILTIGNAYNGDTSTKHFALLWACGYEASSRTLYWNRTINTGNAYNPNHTCTMTVSEVLIKDYK
jgi:hypothetical protein